MNSLPTPPSEPSAHPIGATNATVWIPTNLHPVAIAHAQSRFRKVILSTDDVTIDQALSEAHGMVLRVWPVTREMLLKAPKLKGIARNGVGYDCIDKPTAFERGIAVMNVPGKNAEAVAEQALTLALVLLRRTAELDRRLRNGENIGTGAMGNSLRGKRIGIVGMGAIARRAAELFWDTFQCELHVFSPTSNSMKWTSADPHSLRPLPHTRHADLTTFLPSIDILTIHCPLTPSTKHLIGPAELALLHSQALVINTARGGIVDERALEEALREGRLGGAGIDVWEVEPPTIDRYGGLISLDNVISNPHCGASTDEIQNETCVQAVDQLADYLDGKPARNRVI